MGTHSHRREAFGGIDVACANGKRLPVCVVVRDSHGRLEPVAIKPRVTHPTTRGNKEALDPRWRQALAGEVVAFLRQLEAEDDLEVLSIAIDAPRAPTDAGRPRRACEEAMAREGLSFIATPSVEAFSRVIARAEAHFVAGGALASVPGANLLWMLLGFSLFEALGQQYECLETYPYAVVRRLGCVLHKTTAEGYRAQLAAAAEATGWAPPDLERRLAQTTAGSAHDRLDAFLCAWIASLGPAGRMAYGEPPDDVIWVSRRTGSTGGTGPSAEAATPVEREGSRRITSPLSCPICGKEFAQGRSGWDGHVGSARTHEDWHPDVHDAEERKRLFRSEFPGFFKNSRAPAMETTVRSRHSIDQLPSRNPAGCTSLDLLRAEIAAFVDERDWRQFHSPRNLAAALAVEAGEILEHFQWLTNKQSRVLPLPKLESVRDEIGDVLIYLLRLADELQIDPLDAAVRKLETNREKYPAERVKGDARKYDEY